MSYQKHLYAIMYPNFALVASQLAPADFGRYYSLGSALAFDIDFASLSSVTLNFSLESADFSGELLGLHRDAVEVLGLGRAGRHGVRQERPCGRQFLGFGVALSDLQQQRARSLHRIRCLVAPADTPTEDHHLLELRFHRTVDAQVGEAR